MLPVANRPVCVNINVRRCCSQRSLCFLRSPVNGRNPAEAAERRTDGSPVHRRYYTLILQLDGWTSCLSRAINCCRVSGRTRRPGSNYPEHTSSPTPPPPCDHHPPALMVGSYMEVTTPPSHTHSHYLFL